MNRNPLRGDCPSVISAPGVTATPSVSVSRLVAAAQLFGAAVVAAPGMLESIADARGEVRDTLLGLLDCVDEYEGLMARPPIRRPV